MRNLFRALVVVMGLVAFAPRANAANTVVSFPAGSIIIPSSAAFQSDCGAVSMYGVVYDVLRANAWLAANGYNPITIYYAIADATPTTWSALGKQSPNRCTPSNLDTPPSADPSWTDGCDFQLAGIAPLVKLVKNTSTGIGNDTDITTYKTTGKSIVWPQFANTALATATAVNYAGGPFIIKNDAPNGKTLGSDAATFLALIDGSVVAKDSAGNDIDFSPFRSPMPTVTGGVSSCKFGTDNYVNLHRSKVLFTAAIAKQFNTTPPRLALLDTNNGTGSVSPSIGLSGCGNAPAFGLSGTTGGCLASKALTFAVGDTVVVSGVKNNAYNGTWVVTGINTPVAKAFTFNMNASGVGNSTKGSVQPQFTAEPATKSVSGGILKNYLNNAGLAFDGAQGCPTGGINAADSNICPIGGSAGQIYDALDFADLANNKLALTDSGIPRYTMIWTPHWNTSAGSGTPPTAAEVTALGYIRSFLDGQTGLFAECAAITSYEGTYESGSAKVEGADYTHGQLQLQTCQATAGVCNAATSTTPFGVARNIATAPSGTLRNCSDVTTLSGACAYFGYPQDPFAQSADFAFIPQGGETKDWNPNNTTSSIYRPGVMTLVSGVNSLTDRTKLSSIAAMRASGQIVTDWFTRNVKDNSPGKGNVAYLGGHDLTNQVAATKLVLETLLQLGTSTPPITPTSIEVSRSSPIVASLNSNPAIVQGTFESVTPVVAAPVINLAADVSAWTFPAVFGHMRATVGSTIGTSATAFNAGTLTVLWDAASKIPAVTPGGCGAQRFTGQCRTVFTTTATSATGIVQNPAHVYFEDTNAAAIGSLISPGLAIAQWTTIVDKVLAGAPDGFGGYIPALGGVDRSTVAVIEPSTVAGAVAAARPTMAYFGATDGMLHAVCAVQLLGSACDIAGRELWAFMPRTQLPFVHLNTTRVDGSPHVADVFGAFGAATKSFHTILTFQTGSGLAVTGSTPAVYGIDITDPTAPKVIWEYTAPTVLTAAEVGVGLAMAGGTVNIGGASVNLAFAETNNGGTGGTGVVMSAIDIETGAKKWAFSDIYPALYNGADQLIPASGIPGGAVGVDKTGQGYITDVVFGDLFGRLWMVDPATGASRYTTTYVSGGPQRPLFAYTSDYHPIGAMPAVYSDGTKQFAVFTTGGFDDPADTWGAIAIPAQFAISVDLTTPNTTPVPAQVSQASSTAYVPFQIPLGKNVANVNFGSSTQVLVVGGQLFITSDTADTNKASYGLSGQTGQLQTYSIGALVSSTSSTTIAGGAGSAANAGTLMFTGGGQSQQQMTAATTTVGPSVDSGAVPKLTRNLWLRTL